MASERPAIRSCLQCGVGCAAGVGSGGICGFVPTRVRRNSFLYLQGEPAERVYLIRQGIISLAHAPDGGADESGHVYSLRGPHSLVGIEALCVSEYRSTARAETELKVCSIERERFVAWLAGQGPLANQVLRQVVEQSELDRAVPTASTAGSSEARVAEYFLRSREGKPDEGPEPRWSVVADLLGMRPETLSRCLRRLTDLGAIRREGRRVLPLNVGKLRQIAAGQTA